MFDFDTTNAQRFILSLIGALILSTTCVTAAVGPAQAEFASAVRSI